MSVGSPSNQLTAEHLLRLPDNASMELIGGRIVEKNVSALSSLTELQIAFVFTLYIEKTRSALVFPASMGYECFQFVLDNPHHIRKPSVSVITTERYQALAKKNPTYIPIAPDLAVEVLSADDTFDNVNEKLFEYRGAGIPLVWIVDPIAQTVWVHPNPGKPFIRSEDDELTAESALPGFSCRVSDLFPPL